MYLFNHWLSKMRFDLAKRTAGFSRLADVFMDREMPSTRFVAFASMNQNRIRRLTDMTKLTSSLIVAVFLLLLPVVCFAHATSSTSAVTGTVTDAQGAVVAGATVKLVDSKTSQERTSTTNDRGVYLFAQVPPGQG